MDIEAQHRAAIAYEEEWIRQELNQTEAMSRRVTKEEYERICDFFKNQIKESILLAPLEITIAVAETVVGGGSANSLLTNLNEYINKNNFIKFKVLLERHTVGRNANRVEGEYDAGPKSGRLQLSKTTKDEHINLGKIQKDGRIKVYLRNAPYILGEDVGYQLKYEGQDSMRPIIIFGGSDEVRALAIHPRMNMTAREVLIQLVMGVYDSALQKYGINKEEGGGRVEKETALSS
ncbi:MAG: hypothetical protein F6K65_41635 [Moorea sp. SIO3C2]|nr:hypothetical protein [Moorena sp. SIO3C2]